MAELAHPETTEERHRAEALLLTLFVACLATAAIFTIVASRVHAGDLTALDRAMRDFVIAHDTPFVRVFLDVVSEVGNGKWQVPILAGVAWLVSRSRILVVLVLVCGLTSSEFVSAIKEGFDRTRPATGALERDSSSFPSGHVSSTMAVAVLIAYGAHRYRRYWRASLWIGAVVVLLMAASRVYLDMHWLSDVVGGVFVGGAIGAAFSALYELIRKYRSAPARTASPR